MPPIYAIFVVFSMAAPAFAGQSPSPLCDYAAIAPKPPVTYPGELQSGGEVVNADGKFTASQLRDGRYVFLIVRDQNRKLHVVWGLQSQAPQASTPDRNYLSHLSLWSQAEREFKTDIEVVASGEVNLMNSVAAEFNNRSAKWPGDDRLESTEAVLSKMGIAFGSAPGPSTLRVNYADPEKAKKDSERHHVEAHRRAQWRNQYLSTPAADGALSGVQMEAALRYLQHQLYSRQDLRHATKFGQINTGALIPASPQSKDMDAVLKLVHCIGMLQNDGIEMTVHKYLEKDKQLTGVWHAAKLILGEELVTPDKVPLDSQTPSSVPKAKR
jgi:hypothetical protein